jgi:hypothetical protein
VAVDFLGFLVTKAFQPVKGSCGVARAPREPGFGLSEVWFWVAAYFLVADSTSTLLPVIKRLRGLDLRGFG